MQTEFQNTGFGGLSRNHAINEAPPHEPLHLHDNLLLHMQQKVVSPGSGVQSAKLVSENSHPGLSPSDGERECFDALVERSLFSDPLHTGASGLPLPFLKGEGRGEGSRPLHRYGLAPMRHPFNEMYVNRVSSLSQWECLVNLVETIACDFIGR